MREKLRRAIVRVFTLPWRLFEWMMVARPIRFTRFGVFYILFALGVGAAAINTGNNLLYLILGVLLGFIVVSGFLSDSALWGLEVEWHLGGSAFAGSDVSLEADIRKRWFPAVLVTVTPIFEEGLGPTALLYWLGTRGRERLRFVCRPPKRGRWRLNKVRYASRFPFGLFEKVHTVAVNREWTVYPRLLPEGAETARSKDVGETTAQARLGSSDIPYFIRDFRPGDSPRLIHWKTSARRGHLMVREMESSSSDSPWIGVSRWPAEAGEAFVSFLATLMFNTYRQGSGLGLETPDAAFEPSPSRERIHEVLEYLALVDLRAAPSTRSRSSHRRITDAVALWKETYGAPRF